MFSLDAVPGEYSLTDGALSISRSLRLQRKAKNGLVSVLTKIGGWAECLLEDAGCFSRLSLQVFC
jgi:hypothetical protein